MCFLSEIVRKALRWKMLVSAPEDERMIYVWMLQLHWQSILLWRSWPEQTAVGFQTLDAAVAALGVGEAVRGTRGNLGYLGKGRRRKTWNQHKSRRRPKLYTTGQLASSRELLRFVLLDLKPPEIGPVSSPIPLHLHTSRLLSPHLPSVYVKRGTYFQTSFIFVGSLICHNAWNIMR